MSRRKPLPAFNAGLGFQQTAAVSGGFTPSSKIVFRRQRQTLRVYHKPQYGIRNGSGKQSPPAEISSHQTVPVCPPTLHFKFTQVRQPQSVGAIQLQLAN